MKALFKMDFDCGRMGNLEGVFITDTEDVEYLVNNKISVYFGEVLGKHSEISGCVAESEIKQITTDENVIKIVEEYGLNSGYNPFEYTLCTSETEDIPDNGVDWDDCTVQEYIDRHIACYEDKGKTSVSLPIDNIMDTLKKYTV